MSLEQLDALYREVILEHFKNSAHSGALPGAQINATGANPLCGDEITFYLTLTQDTIQQVRFEGTGCAISQATASMLSQQLEGKTRAGAMQLIDAMKRLMHGHAPDAAVELGDLEVLAGVRKFPVRIKCAALSWNIVEQGLKEYGQKSNVRNQSSETQERSV